MFSVKKRGWVYKVLFKQVAARVKVCHSDEFGAIYRYLKAILLLNPK